MRAGAPVQKPRAEFYQPGLTRLPEYTSRRRIFRRFARWLCRAVVVILARPRVFGMENFPQKGPALLVTNHLGDADGLMGIAFFPGDVDALAKLELYKFPLLGKFMEAYGVIWVHRGSPDRRALQAALKGLKEGRLLALAPEGRQSLTGALEEGTGGAAYLALKANVAVVPVSFTGTENSYVFERLKHLRRPIMTMTIGPAFRLHNLPDQKQAIAQGTDQIMVALAKQLPEKYRGFYKDLVEDENHPASEQKEPIYNKRSEYPS